MLKLSMPFHTLSRTAFKALIYIAGFIAISSALDYWRGKNLPAGSIPQATYTSISGDPIDIATLSQDELTVIYFWASWCGPCKVTSPSIKQLAKHYPVVTIALNSGEDSELVEYFTPSKHGIATVNDGNGTISQHWGVGLTPTVLFVKHGKILSYTMGVSTYPGLLMRAWWASF